MNFCWSVWLVPHPKKKSKYQELINLFCNRYGSPIFNPHVTLYGRLSIDPESTFPFFDKLITDYQNFNLNPKKLKLDTPPWKSLIITFNENTLLNEFQKEINYTLKGSHEYIFEPHLSLAYGNFKCNQDDFDLISLDESICFSDVALVMTPDQIQEWKIIKTFKLNKSEK